MSIKTKRSIKIITTPFTSLSLPSLEVAILKAFLEERNYNVTVIHLYIKYAETLGKDLYNFVRRSSFGDKLFSSLLYKEKYIVHKNSIKEDFCNQDIDFDSLAKKTEESFQKFIQNINFNKDDVIIFYMYSEQFLPSLYCSKLIKDKYDITVWLAGFNCVKGLGETVTSSFPFVDEVFAENLEENIILKLEPDCTLKGTESLDFLPTPDYSDYFEEIKKSSFKNKSKYYLQVEFSRGCWWNSCTFCSLNCMATDYRERSPERILEDYIVLQKKYNTTQILTFQFVDSKNWREYLSILKRSFPHLRDSFNFNFKVSSLQKEEDFKILKNAGSSILVGTESFCQDYLDLLNKGQTVIENILVLKYAERYGVPFFHNIMYGLPFETDEFYKNSVANISFIYHLPPPFDNEKFRLTYPSLIFKDMERFGITAVSFRHGKETDLFPESVQNILSPFFYDFQTLNDESLHLRESKWLSLIKEWREIYYGKQLSGCPKRTSLLYMSANKWVLDIYDNRNENNPKVYSYTGFKRELYEFCDQIKNYEDIKNAFSDKNSVEIKKALNEFVLLKLMFKQNDEYLSLAV